MLSAGIAQRSIAKAERRWAAHRYGVATLPDGMESQRDASALRSVARALCSLAARSQGTVSQGTVPHRQCSSQRRHATAWRRWARVQHRRGMQSAVTLGTALPRHRPAVRRTDVGTFRKGTIVTIYSKRQRYEWRRRTRRLVWRVNLLLAMTVALLVLMVAATAPAQAAPRCPCGGQPDRRGRCTYSLPTMTCAWPARIVKIGQVAVCWRPAAEVQP